MLAIISKVLLAYITMEYDDDDDITMEYKCHAPSRVCC